MALDVVDVAFGGDGIARHDGKVYFVEQAVPGETVEVEILQDKKRFARVRAVRTLEAAPDAIPGFCPVFGSCGGCDWQHVPYPKQVEWKASFIKSALFKNAQIEWPEEIKVLPSEDIHNYRNRIKLKARMDAQQRLEFGYFAKSSHTPVFIAQCPIADPAINAFLDELKNFTFPKAFRWQGDMEIQALTKGQRLIHFNPDFPAEALTHLRTKFVNDKIESPGFLALEDHEGIHYATQAGQFQQVNIKGNRTLRSWIKAKVEAIGAKTVLDLFCGSGNLSMQFLAKEDEGLRVWGLELADKAIDTAQYNLERNGFIQGGYKAGPVSELHQIFRDLPATLDCIITDPPRQGMDDSLEEVLKLRPLNILSVSCDPNTFARDLKGILEKGYVLKEIFGMDFFPHTYHIETVAHLSLESHN